MFRDKNKIEVDPKRLRDLEVACGLEPSVDLAELEPEYPSVMASFFRSYTVIGRVIAAVFKRRNNIVFEHMAHHHPTHWNCECPYPHSSPETHKDHECPWCIAWSIVSGGSTFSMAICAGISLLDIRNTRDIICAAAYWLIVPPGIKLTKYFVDNMTKPVPYNSYYQKYRKD